MPGIHHTGGIGVFLRTRKKRQKNFGYKYGIFLCLVTRYKGFLTKKGLQIMMSSLLNVSNGSSKSEKFSLNDIEVLFDSDGENWCLSRDLTPKKCPKEMILRQW